MSAPAYHYADLTYCESCALKATQLGCLTAGVDLPLTMEDAIATMMLLQISAGIDVDVPVAVTAHGTCECCGAEYGTPAPQDAA